MLAAADKRGGLALYAVQPRTHLAVAAGRLDGPAGMDVVSVSLSSGTSPTVCAVWGPVPVDSGVPRELWCYAPGAKKGRRISRAASFGVGVRADGRALAYAEVDEQHRESLVIADLAGGVATIRSRMPYAKDLPPGGIPEGLGDVDWIGPRTLGITGWADSDEGEGLCITDLGHPRQPDGAGFGRCLKPGRAEQRLGYAHFEQAAQAAPGVVVAVERARWCCDDEGPDAPGGRAVQLRLADGAVLGVVATPRADRDVVDISGGSRAILYTTAVVNKDRIVSLRWEGEAHGAPLTGLPADLTLATAQP
jgi:hypothetical protein